MREYGRVRLRESASQWGISRDLETTDRYLETFMCLRGRKTCGNMIALPCADSELERRLRSYTRLEPIVRHFLYL